jgi:vanillate O-demethylase monooxygenase subunit
VLPGVLLMDSGSAPANSGAPQGDRKDCAEFFGCQAITPETDSTSHYFFQQSHGFALDDPQVTENLRLAVLAGFQEDKDMIEAQQRVLNMDPNFRMLGLRMDTALGNFRLLVEKVLADEQRVPSAASAA